MIASAYIKDGNIHLYNEKNSFTDIGGIAYELGKPLLDFICYDTGRFDESFSLIAEAFDFETAHIDAKDPAFISGLRQLMNELQQNEVYVFLYGQIFMEFIYAFIDSPQMAVKQLDDRFPGAQDRFRWAWDFFWPVTNNPYPDMEKRLFRAAKDAVAVLHQHLCVFHTFIKSEIEVLLHYRGEIEVPAGRSIDYIDILDEFHIATVGECFYIENTFRTRYGRVATGEIEQLYEIDSAEDLFRFEFIKMIEHEIFIKKCKNCESFFIPRRRADTEYCDREIGDSGRRCNEVGAMLRYERKVAENPILDAHKKAYRRFNSRVRTKKMTQTEFMAWSDEAAKKRDACLAGELSFDEFMAWLEQGRIRKPRSKPD